MNLSEFHFIRPLWLLTLLPYAMAIAYVLRRRLSRGNWSALCDAELMPYLLQDTGGRENRWSLITGSIAALLSILALAGPTWERLPLPVFRNDSALVILLDLSQTMDASDIKPSRLALARYKIADILKRRKDGQTALIAYAGDAFTVTPLTNDTDTIENQLTALTTEIMPEQGNNLSLALTKAVDLFKQSGLQSGQILLLSDGGGTDEITQMVKNLGNFTLSIIGVGTTDGAPVSLGSGGFLKDNQGNIVVAKLDQNILKQCAQAGNGSYHLLTTDDTDVNQVLSDITAKLSSKANAKDNLVIEQWQDQGPWLLLLVLPFAALSFRKGLFGILLLVLLPFPDNSYAFDISWQDLWATKNQQAQKAYRDGDYKKAAELFENSDWKAAAHYESGNYDKTLENLKDNASLDGLYNQGNALAKSGQLQQALGAYNKALQINPNDQDTLYNKDLIEKMLKDEEQKEQQDKNNQPSQQQDKNDKNAQDKQQQSGQQNQDKNEQNNKPQDNAQKPEQKPEQSQNDLSKQAEQKADEEKKQADDKQHSMQDQQSKQDDQQVKNKPETSQAIPADMSKEEQQAHEQWLNRIPDDPSGLLKRKFKYQYDLRRRRY
jgi:Ca-activated chloride channel family protein